METQSDAGAIFRAAVRLSGIAGVWGGPHKNVYHVSNFADAISVAAACAAHSLRLERQTDYAQREGITRQAVQHRLWRDGIALVVVSPQTVIIISA